MNLNMDLVRNAMDDMVTGSNKATPRSCPEALSGDKGLDDAERDRAGHLRLVRLARLETPWSDTITPSIPRAKFQSR